MSISMERFSSDGRFLTYDPFPVSLRPVTVFQLQCRSCGYEPDGAVTPPEALPQVPRRILGTFCPSWKHPGQRQPVLTRSGWARGVRDLPLVSRYSG